MDERAYGALMEDLAESVLRAPDETLRAEGVEAESEDVRGFLRGVGKDYRQRYLRAAAAEYKERLREMSTRWVDLPDGPAERRALLASVFERHPAMQTAYLTVQHREFRELTDADVESVLVQLLELGVLP